jgi:multimeric flavodoxin WrbA
MVNIVIINGSPRKNGATATLLKKMSEHLSGKSDVNIDYLNISEYSLMNCTGCMSCYKNGVCYLNDDVEKINSLVTKAHGVIIGSPTYSSSMPGSLKTYIDRGHFVLEQSLLGKYMFALNTYEIAGGNSVISALKTLFQYSGGILTGSYICKLPFNSTPFSNKKTEEKLIDKTEHYFNCIKKRKSKSAIDKLINFVALHLIMKPQVLKRPEQYSAIIKRWKTIGVINN